MTTENIFIDYIVTPLGNPFSKTEIELTLNKLKKEYPNVKIVEVESEYYKESAIIFVNNDVDLEQAKIWFEKQQEEVYGENNEE